MELCNSALRWNSSCLESTLNTLQSARTSQLRLTRLASQRLQATLISMWKLKPEPTFIITRITPLILHVLEEHTHHRHHRIWRFLLDRNNGVAAGSSTSSALVALIELQKRAGRQLIRFERATDVSLDVCKESWMLLLQCMWI